MANPFFGPDSSARTSKLAFTNASPPATPTTVPYNNYPFNGLWMIPVNTINSVPAPPFGQCFYQWSARALAPTNDKGNFYDSAFVVVTDSVCAPQSVGGAGALTINGRFASAGSVVFNWGLGNTTNPPGQNITAQSSKNETATLTITGTDRNAAGITDTMTFGGTKLSVQANPSTKIFATVTGVSSSAALNGIVMLGQTSTPSGTYASFNQTRSFYRNYLKANNASIAAAAAGIGYGGGFTTPLATISGPLINYSTAIVTTTLGASPLQSTAGSNEIVVHQVAHGFTSGQFVNAAGAASMPSNIPAADFSNVTTVDRVIDADNWVALSTIFAAATATGGGSAVIIQTIVPTLYKLHGASPNPPMQANAIGSPQINVNFPGHGLINGEAITVIGVTAGVGGIPAASINGARTINSIIDANNFSFNAAANATMTTFGGSNTFIQVQPLLTTNGSNVLTVRMTNGLTVSPEVYGTGVSTGDSVALGAWSGVGGLTAGQINGAYTITGTPTSNSYTVTLGANATSTASGGGTGNAAFTYNMKIGQYQATDAVSVSVVHVDAATAGAITVGGIYDGANAVAHSQTPGAAGNLTLTSSPVTLTQDQYLTISSTGNDSGRTFTITGVNSIGQTWTLAVAGPNTGTIQVPYNALLPLIQNAANPLLDVIILPDAVAPGSWVVLDYEVGDQRSSVDALNYIRAFASMCQAAPGGAKRLTFFTDALNAASAKNNAYSNWMMAQLAGVVGFSPTMLLSPNNPIPDINQQYQFMQGLLGGIKGPAGFNYALMLDLGPSTKTLQATQMRLIMETYGYAFFLPFRDNSVPGNSSAYDAYNLKLNACANGAVVNRSQLAVL